MIPILEIHNIVKQYADHTALNDVSMNVPQGQIFGLLGPNGAGKTSLIRIINQITAPDTGYILFNGEPLQEKHIAQIGYLPEERGLYKKMKVGEQMLYLARLKGLSQSEALERTKKWFIKFGIEAWWDKTVEDLSKGMSQKVQFIATVLHDPKLIILDEPFSGFDPINANLIKDEILELKERGHSIIFSTHRMESVEELCDHVALIDKAKKILDGPKEQIKEQFKSNTFTVEFNGTLTVPEDTFSVQSLKPLPGNRQQAVLKPAEGISGNQLIAALIPQVEVRSFSENIPSMNEVFIKAVQRQ